MTEADRPGANRVKVGFFSLTAASPSGHDREYLTWHQLDHMPEQYRLHGVVLGQRFRSTPACRQRRAASVGDWDSVEHVVCYLMGEPVDRTVDDFLALGRELAEAGRYPQTMPSCYRGALHLDLWRAASRVLVSAEVVPFRPHLGIYLLVAERTPDEGAADATGAAGADDLDELRSELAPALLATPGVAGVWSFGTSATMRRRMFTPGDLRMTVCYLDDDPAETGGRLSAVVREHSGRSPGPLLLAAPFESVVRWEWERGLADSP